MATERDWALKMIPVLVRWAYGAWNVPHYYSDLSRAVSLNTNRIGKILGTLQDIIDELKEEPGKSDIPTLNGLVRLKDTNLPADGFDYVIPNYSKLSDASKRGEVSRLNYVAHLYDWTWVINKLNLTLDKGDRYEIKQFGYGGEGEKHKNMKTYICNHPSAIALKGVVLAEVEYGLLSGDKIDVYFECKGNIHYAVEVKPITSDENDIRRGIFQCVKYKTIMDAERLYYVDNYENHVLLVMAGEMSEENKLLALGLNVHYIERFSLNM